MESTAAQENSRLSDLVVLLKIVVVVFVIVPTTLCVLFVLYVLVFEDLSAYGEFNGASEAQIGVFAKALDRYKDSFHEYPESLSALLEPPAGRPFLTTRIVPPDPWGNPYAYSLNGEHGYTITSFGRDGRPGGQGLNEDVTLSAP